MKGISILNRVRSLVYGGKPSVLSHCPRDQAFRLADARQHHSVSTVRPSIQLRCVKMARLLKLKLSSQHDEKGDIERHLFEAEGTTVFDNFG